MLAYCSLYLWEQNSVKLELKYINFDSRKKCENVVCIVAAILSRPNYIYCPWPVNLSIQYLRKQKGICMPHKPHNDYKQTNANIGIPNNGHARGQ